MPSYVTLIFVACAWAARSVGAPWSTIGTALACGAVAAGGLDLIENAGILAEVLLQWPLIAPLTHAACLAKWSIASTGLLYALGRGFLWLFIG